MNDLPANDATHASMMPGCRVRITAGSRLHFGLLDTVEPFGGLGLMIDQPLTEVVVSPSDRFECKNDQDEPRIREIAQRVAEFANLSDLPRCQIAVKRRPLAHCGFGSGTQLALAVAEAMCRCLSIRCDAFSLAGQIAGRGQRSAVGIHGYFGGGLIYEGPSQPTAQHVQSSALNSLRLRIELPSPWCVGLFRPRDRVESVSGEFEKEQFASLRPAADSLRSSLERIVNDEVSRAAAASDFPTFASAVHRYNQESGKLFAPVQGGPYNGPAVTRMIGSLIELGANGVGQSSWGPGVFAWFESQQDAEAFCERLTNDIVLVAITRPLNQARTLQTLPVGS